MTVCLHCWGEACAEKSVFKSLILYRSFLILDFPLAFSLSRVLGLFLLGYFCGFSFLLL